MFFHLRHFINSYQLEADVFNLPRSASCLPSQSSTPSQTRSSRSRHLVLRVPMNSQPNLMAPKLRQPLALLAVAAVVWQGTR